MLDFNHEEEQKVRNFGPVPAGSRVMIRLTLEAPRYPSADDASLSETKSGLLQLPCKLTVANGEYEGVSWLDFVTIPEGQQRVRLTDGQLTSARIGGAFFRAVVEAHRGIDPKAMDARASKGRQIRAWTDLDGMEFPARLGLQKEPYESKDGKLYWNNRIARVLACTDKEYIAIKRGEEFITDGPVTGGDNAPAPTRGGSMASSGSHTKHAQQASAYDDPFADVPHPVDHDGVPF